MQFSIPGGNFLRKSGGTMGGMILMGGNDIDDIGSLNPGGPGLTTGPLWGDEHPQLVKKVASANLRHSHDAEVNNGGSSGWFLMKTITFSDGLLGQQRITAQMRTGNPPTAGHMLFCRNGYANQLGAQMDDVSGNYTLFTLDVTRDWAPGDTLELWLDGALNVDAKEFRVSYDDAATVAVAAVNS